MATHFPDRRGRRWAHAAFVGMCAMLLSSLASSAVAQTAEAAAKVAMYQGADRTQRLTEGAKREGVLTVYNSAPVDDMAVVTAAFEAKYGVKVRVWRSSSENVLQRAVAEARGGRFDVDIVETNAPEMESLHREKLLQEVKSPYFADLIAPAVLPHREWIGTRLNIFVAAYNTRLLKKEDLPRTYEDLLNQKWKGKLGIEADDLDWFAGVVGALGETDGVKLFRNIVTTNGISIRKGHTLLTNLVVSGEIPLALTVYEYKAQQLKHRGAPIDWLAIPPAVARFQGVGLARHAPHPNAGVLFFDFMLTDAQQLLLKRDFVPTSRKVESPFSKIPVRLIDPKVVLDENAKWDRLYKETFTNQSR